ncbi:MAG: sugar phosphate isomerase/epimerase [Pirellulales bacterium]|nr:sugar phosphate isomerase/epimerase [Pirellulales bacterium]
MKPALSQVCSLASPFEKDFTDYAAGHCPAIELWLGKLEGYLETHTLDDVRRLRGDVGVATPVASFQGGLFVHEGQARGEHWRHFEQRLSLCRQLEIGTLVVAGDIQAPIGQAELDGIVASLRQAADQAAAQDVRLALEFQCRATFANNLQTAAALVDEIAHPALGLCCDAFHYYCGPSKLEDLASVPPGKLFHVQLCDLAGQPRELAVDSDRVLPGDGDFQLESLLGAIHALGYAGYVSIELMNPQIWTIPARQFGEVAMTALRKVLGQASMK